MDQTVWQSTSLDTPAPLTDPHVRRWPAIQARRERGEKGGSFPGPATFGGRPSLKNTETGVPDDFFLTSNMHKIHF